MARTSNRKSPGPQAAPEATETGWRAGLYVRLSREDGGRPGLDESNSVRNQKEILERYCREQGSQFSSTRFYVDDGCTGTDSHRAGFQRLLGDIAAKRINCVIVKDLSRLSRNYAEAGHYIDCLFVQNGVRFICLAEPVIDSYLDPASAQSVAVPFYNVINDMVARQTSEKVRQVFDAKRARGYFISGYAPYGYRLDPERRGHLVEDEEAAGTVRLIFQLFCQGMSKRGIAGKLNDLGVPAPAAYKWEKGVNYRAAGNGDSRWQYGAVHRILQNPVYTGTMVQGRQRRLSYKVHHRVSVPREEWFVVEGTHRPIVDKALFDTAQQLLMRDTRAAPRKHRVHLFSGFLRCGDCGAPMVRRTCSKPNGYRYIGYACSAYKNKRGECSGHSIRHEELEAAVFAALSALTALVAEGDRLAEALYSAPAAVEDPASVEAAERRLERVKRYRRGLYQQQADGYLTQAEYLEMLAEYREQERGLTARLEELRARNTQAPAGTPTAVERLLCQGLPRLDRELLAAFVDTVYIGEEKRIRIVFRARNPFGGAAEGGELS